MTTVVILQPSYLPWLGFFDQMRRCDVFVYYDDVQFDKNGWRNRNRVKGPGGPHWLTVPVIHSGRFGQRIRDVEIDRRAPWQRKHIGTLRQFYGRSPYATLYLPRIAELLDQHWRLIADLDIALNEQIGAWLGIRRKVVRASDLGIGGGQSERLAAICEYFNAKRYLSGAAARGYLDVHHFARRGIVVDWQDYVHPVYPQLYGDFISHLSAVDFLLNVGPECARVMETGV
jgi:hypothetical protein